MKFNEDMMKGTFGLELESLRITEDGFLSKKSHPFNKPYITRDFAECQMEMITGVHDSVDGMYEELKSIYKQVDCTLSGLENGREYIWPFSNPPHIRPNEEVNIAYFQKEEHYRYEYRCKLAKRYGKKRMLYSGIHFNYSFDERAYKSKLERNYRYVVLSSRIVKYSWIIVLLMGASPVFDSSLINNKRYGESCFENEASRRCGKNGYWNKFIPVLDYSSYERYIQSINCLSKKGLIYSESELYYPVRLKSQDSYLIDNLLCYGVNHLEIRTIDINPLSQYGVKLEDLRFIHLLIVYLNSQIENDIIDYSIDFNEREQIYAINEIFAAALFDNTKLFKRAIDIIKNIKTYFCGNISKEYENAIDYQLDKLCNCDDNMYSHIILSKYGQDYVSNGIKTAKENSKKLKEK